MDPVIDTDWLGFKNDPIDEPHSLGNVARSWQWRERGINPPNSTSNKTVLENIAEDILVKKPLKIRRCDLPGYPRSTFLMVFSPDGTKVASTHANHDVYVSDLASGKHVRILKGHPRTPWCIAFHPSHLQLIGSGCLGGQVRVWDISSGGSEVWNVRNETVISSIAFHPRKQLLVIATYNELYFWDWSQPAPFTKVSTNTINEKVRYVAFDSLGYKLITGISLWAVPPNSINGPIHQNNPNTNNDPNNQRRDESDDNSGNGRIQDNNGSTQDLIVNSYQNLVQRYDSLVRNYQRLFMVRHRLTATPSPPSTTDRGTDPMETDPSPESNSYTRTARTYSVTPREDDENGTARDETDPLSISDAEGNSSRIFNLDALSFENTPTRDPSTSHREHSLFGSRQSAFQPLNDSSRRTFRTVDQRERTRLLPNPFSSTNVTPRPSRFTFSNRLLDQQDDTNSNSSRTSIFPAYRSATPLEVLDLSSRRSAESQQATLSALNENLTNEANMTSQLDSPSTSNANNNQRQTNGSDAALPMSGPVDAQTINESLDLIRDILRDSGTRLLNLITNMSLSTLANVERRERSLPRRRTNSRAQSDENDVSERPRTTRPRVRLFSSSLRQEFLSSSSESDSDQSPEVNILRTRNSTFREDDIRHPTRSSNDVPLRLMRPTDRLVFELGEPELDDPLHQPGGINVTANSSRFHVRSQSNVPDAEPSTSTRDNSANTDQRSQNNPEFDPNRPSTSRDNFWAGGAVFPPDEAYRKVREGVNALQKHTMQLTNLWLRGNRITMRELRNMWENLRRRILMLHRETGRQDMPTYYTRSLLERCMMLSDMTDHITRGSSRTSRTNPRFQETNRNTESSNNVSMNSQSDFNLDGNEPSTSAGDTRPTLPHRSPQARHSSSLRSSPAQRRRQTGFRLRLEDELRRRSRNSAATRLSQRYSTRPRREFVRAVEISATRNEIRMRAMQVLSVMFNMMMMCLEERGLSQLIINMLRTLKKALALTCLMLMTNRNGGRTSNISSPQRVDSANVIRLENIDNTEPINVDGPDEPPQNLIQNEPEAGRSHNDIDNTKHIKREAPSTSKASTSNASNITETLPSTSGVSIAQRWSNRLAVQIAAANRNTSATARNRRELYMESKRLKALHRTNPIAHPMAKRKVLPPVSTYKIPALRWPLRKSISRPPTVPRIQPVSDEPVAGPSGINTSNNNSFPTRLNLDMMHNFEYRINLIRMAHMQAVRLRNAARNRFRRLQTIRLYTPSSVREMFSLQPNSDNQRENRSYLQSSPAWYEYTSRILSRDRVFYRGPMRHSEESGQFQAVISNAAVPLMQVGDLPAGNSDNQGNQTLRRARIHEYLQPIILAQNSMVVDEEGNGEGSGGGGNGGGAARRLGGMAGLLDAGIISEALPAQSHRVQAWDFTAGVPPDIADSTKNIVVQRCRIHNDASIDISKDGRLLVALLPAPRLRNTNHWLGVYSLEWSRLGQCLHTAAFEHSAVSVALSPTARHLAVGLGARRFTSAPARTNVFALLYRLDPLESSSRTGLSPIKELEQTWEHGFTSLNCLRWAPQAGQGLVYADNTGQLIVMS